MKQITLKIQDGKFAFFMELIKNFSFIEVQETKDDTSKKEILDNIKQGLEEVQLIEKGKMKSTPLKDFLNEL